MLLTTLATIGSIGAAIYGAAKSAKYSRQAQEDLTKNHDDTQRVLQSRLYSDYTNRTDFQNLFNRQRELLDQQVRRANARSVVSGASEEQAALAKEAANKAMADTMSNVAARAASYKEGVENQMLNENRSHTQQMAGLKMKQAEAVANAAGQVSQAMSGIASADNATLGDDLAMFGLDTSNYERIIGSDGLPHLYRKQRKTF